MKKLRDIHVRYIVLPTADSGINGAHSENERIGNIINDAG